MTDGTSRHHILRVFPCPRHGAMLGVAEECFGLWKSVDHQRSAAEIAHLTFAEQHDQRPPLAIAHGM
jgi:hypothetical protein